MSKATPELRWMPGVLLLLSLSAGHLLFARPAPQAVLPADLQEAVAWLDEPGRIDVQHDYVMTGHLRLLLFWVKRDDIGGGYIRWGRTLGGAPAEVIDLKFGSDPRKAPRRINRWGAARELYGRREVNGRAVPMSTFFGFMKATGGDSREEIESTLEQEAGGERHLFEATVNRVVPGEALAGILRLASEVDFTMDQYDEASARVLATYGVPDAPVSVRRSPEAAGCDEARGFLQAVRGLIAAALAEADFDRSVCYLYNARPYTLSLRADAPVARERVAYTLQGDVHHDVTYHDLRRLNFEVLNHESGARTAFRLLVGASGRLRGVPIRIEHQPNWWFKVTLHLHPAAAALAARKTE